MGTTSSRRWLFLGVLLAACGKEPVAPVTLQRCPGRPGERLAVRLEHKMLNPVSAHQSIEVSKKASFVDEVQPDGRVVRIGSFDAKEIRVTLTRHDGRLVNDLGERQDVFEQFEALLPERPVLPGDRWQARDFWGTWGLFPFLAGKLRSVRAACAYQGEADGVGRIHVEILAETGKGPYALQGSLQYDLAAGRLVRVALRGTGDDLRHVMTVEREQLR